MTDKTAAEWTPSERADLFDQRRRGVGRGRHRAIRQHAFVQWRGDDKHGCGRAEDDDPDVRCGYYRHNHPTMLSDADD